jgi:hypothetical protein
MNNKKDLILKITVLCGISFLSFAVAFFRYNESPIDTNLCSLILGYFLVAFPMSFSGYMPDMLVVVSVVTYWPLTLCFGYLFIKKNKYTLLIPLMVFLIMGAWHAVRVSLALSGI